MCHLRTYLEGKDGTHDAIVIMGVRFWAHLVDALKGAIDVVKANCCLLRRQWSRLTPPLTAAFSLSAATSDPESGNALKQSYSLSHRQPKQAEAKDGIENGEELAVLWEWWRFMVVIRGGD
jgi:hypothetical protein